MKKGKKSNCALQKKKRKTGANRGSVRVGSMSIFLSSLAQCAGV